MSAQLLAAATLVLNALVVCGSLVWAVAKIKADINEKISSEREETTKQIAALRSEFFREQQSQDHNFGEVGAAMRQYIATVEKMVHEVEIWGRDNFVLKSDFAKATDKIETAISTMAADIKADFKALNQKIDAKT